MHQPCKKPNDAADSGVAPSGRTSVALLPSLSDRAAFRSPPTHLPAPEASLWSSLGRALSGGHRKREVPQRGSQLAPQAPLAAENAMLGNHDTDAKRHGSPETEICPKTTQHAKRAS